MSTLTFGTPAFVLEPPGYILPEQQRVVPGRDTPVTNFDPLELNHILKQKQLCPNVEQQ